MKAALVQTDHTLRVEETPRPEAGRGELLIEVACCGVCGTDVHMLRAGLFPAGCIIGHEISGHVAGVGVGVEGWTEGDRVVVLPIDPCLSCESCRQGDTNLCEDSLVRTHGMGINPGGFCQYLRVRPSALFRVPDGMDLKAAALAEPLAVAVRAVGLSGIPAGGSAVVMGAGPVGLLTVYALKAAGAGQICVTELDPWRAQRARRAGADVVLDPRVQNPAQELQQRTGSAPRHVFDCAGTANSMEEAAGIVGRHGHVVVVGIHFDGYVNLVPMTWFLKETAVRFSLGYDLREFGHSLALLARGAVDPEVLISEVLPLGQIGKALEMLLSPGHERILIDCRDAG